MRKKLPPLHTTCLAALLLAGCWTAAAESLHAESPVAQDAPESRTSPPTVPAVPPATEKAARDKIPATEEAVADPGDIIRTPEVTPELGAQTAAPAPQEDAPATAAPLPANGVSAEDPGGDAAEIRDPEAPSTAVPAFDPATLHDEWIVREQHPDAGEVVTLFSINPDGTFAGTLTVAGNVVWRYSGNWYLEGNLITWFYTQSTPTLMLVDETEVDELISVDSEKLVYRSGKRGVLETLYRSGRQDVRKP